MPDRFAMSMTAVEESKLLFINVRGSYSSREYFDEVVRLYQTIDEPWLYNRLVDLRKGTGYLEFEDIQAYANWWNDLTRDIAYSAKVAVVHPDPISANRAGLAGHYFPKEVYYGFTDMDDALDWLKGDTG